MEEAGVCDAQHERFAYLDPVIVELPEQPPVPSVQVHFGNADQVIAGRKSMLREAWAAHTERFVSGGRERRTRLSQSTEFVLCPARAAGNGPRVPARTLARRDSKSARYLQF